MQANIDLKPEEHTIARKFLNFSLDLKALREAGAINVAHDRDWLLEQCETFRKSMQYFPYKKVFTFADNSEITIFDTGLAKIKGE